MASADSETAEAAFAANAAGGGQGDERFHAEEDDAQDSDATTAAERLSRDAFAADADAALQQGSDGDVTTTATAAAGDSEYDPGASAVPENYAAYIQAAVAREHARMDAASRAALVGGYLREMQQYLTSLSPEPFAASVPCTFAVQAAVRFTRPSLHAQTHAGLAPDASAYRQTARATRRGRTWRLGAPNVASPGRGASATLPTFATGALATAQGRGSRERGRRGRERARRGKERARRGRGRTRRGRERARRGRERARRGREQARREESGHDGEESGRVRPPLPLPPPPAFD